LTRLSFPLLIELLSGSQRISKRGTHALKEHARTESGDLDMWKRERHHLVEQFPDNSDGRTRLNLSSPVAHPVRSRPSNLAFHFRSFDEQLDEGLSQGLSVVVDQYNFASPNLKSQETHGMSERSYLTAFLVIEVLPFRTSFDLFSLGIEYPSEFPSDKARSMSRSSKTAMFKSRLSAASVSSDSDNPV
jgi:hypothetical protein